MAEKVYAVTNIKLSNDMIYEAGQELDTDELKSALTVEQRKALYDAGAIEIREEPEVAEDDAASVEDDTTPVTIPAPESTEE